MVKALYFEKLEGGRVRCGLCPHACVLGEGKQGICRGKKNIGGELHAVNFGRVVSLALDPIEKKPLYHFYPGTQILSAGPNGCNFRCRFCQNWNISQETVPTREISPQDLAREASRHSSIGLAYTYSEPFIWYEFVQETSQAVRALGLKNVLVTNGFVNEKPLRDLLPLIDAMNVDIKSMDASFYATLCFGELDPVLETVRVAHAGGCHVEITNLVIPGRNDTDEDFRKLTDWMAELSPDIPLHFSRYFPNFKMKEASTPVDTLARARSMALQKLNYVYVGNLAHESWGDTFCPKCGKCVIRRRGYDTDYEELRSGTCGRCGFSLAIVCG